MEKLLGYMMSIIDMNERERQLVKSVFKPKNYEQGDYILEEGRICKEIGFIIQGIVIYSIEEKDESHVYSFGKENEFVCNYESFLTKTPSSKSIKCIENVEMLCISYDNLQILYDEVVHGQKLGRLISEQLFLEASANITSFYTDSPEQRYKQFLHFHSDLIQRIPQYLIASYIKIKPQSLSRIRKRMLKK
ncbi:MAG TPA: Crp/Fnr family transcriptional regulator [Sphingobacterium sp.]|nr:Crp/Fnr family transcriptional regulator [Sphingobacterium sp.]